jgi:hypothetical protein
VRRRQEFVNAEEVPLEWRLRWGKTDLVEWADSMVGDRLRGTVRRSHVTIGADVISGEVQS